MRCVTIKVTEAEIDRLVTKDYLKQEERAEAAALQFALEAFVADQLAR
jgi:hypothetical protein